MNPDTQDDTSKKTKKEKIDFHKTLKDYFKRINYKNPQNPKGATGNVPPVYGEYKAFYRSSSLSQKLDIQPKDLDNFKEVYKVKPNNNFGNGEVALFWLYNYGGTKQNGKKGTPSKPLDFVKSDPPQGSLADLSFGNIPVEIKAYPAQHDSIVKLGMWTGVDNGNFLKLVTDLFSLDNIINDKQTSAKRFTYKDLERAAEELCLIRHAFANLDRKDKETIQSFPYFEKIAAKIQGIDQMFIDDNRLQDCRVGTGDRPGGDVIAIKLLEYFLAEYFDTKPGVGGYVVNVPGSGGRLSRTTLDITKIVPDKIDSTGFKDGIKFEDLNLKLAFGKLFR